MLSVLNQAIAIYNNQFFPGGVPNPSYPDPGDTQGYTGYLSYEAPNPDLWARSPYEVAREGVELTQKLLNQALPGYASA